MVDLHNNSESLMGPHSLVPRPIPSFLMLHAEMYNIEKLEMSLGTRLRTTCIESRVAGSYVFTGTCIIKL